MNVTVLPTVQPWTLNWNRPNGKKTPAGGATGTEPTDTNCGLTNVQPAPPPARVTVPVPPVANGPVNDVWMTVAVADAVLFAGVPSGVVLATVATAVSAVLPAALALTLTTSENGSGPETARLGFVHVTVPVPPTAGVAHAQPPGDASETNVVDAGNGIVSDVEAAADGPALVTPTEYVTFAPGATVRGAATLVTERSAGSAAPTTMFPVSESFAGFVSVEVVVTDPVAAMLPGSALTGTRAVTPKLTFDGGMLGTLQEIVPPAPTAGVTHDHPPGETRDTKVSVAGNVWVNVTFDAGVLVGLVSVTV